MKQQRTVLKPNAIAEPTEPAQPMLQEAAIRELVNAAVITGFIARGQDGGFVVEAALGADGGRTAVLGNTRSGPRVFASLATIAMLLKRLGFDHFSVDTAHYEPGRVRAARPERSAAMKAGKLPRAADAPTKMNSKKTVKA